MPLNPGAAPAANHQPIPTGESALGRPERDSPYWSLGADGRYRNPVPTPKRSFAENMRLLWSFFNRPPNRTPSGPLPVQTLTREAILAAPDRTLFRLGHSTLLLKLRGGVWLTDPVFAERASFVQWAGPKRFHEPPIAVHDLPEIEGVILSHDHYDHLDRATIAALASKTRRFVTPLGVGDRLIGWGVDAAKVTQLDWWQSTMASGLRLVATPAQHFSGRGLHDANTTLWASWVIIDGDQRLFFSGDSGYFEGFKAIGERLGPFDLTMMEAGAYNHQWSDVHMFPEQTVQAHLDLRGKRLLPIHNGTFDLAMHTWQDPLERVSALAAARGIEVLTPRIGAPLDMLHPAQTPAWWQSPLAGDVAGFPGGAVS